MSEMFSFLVSNGGEIVGALAMIVGGFAVIARFTPNKSDDRIIQMLLDVINFTGMNHGKASNKDD